MRTFPFSVRHPPSNGQDLCRFMSSRAPFRWTTVTVDKNGQFQKVTSFFLPGTGTGTVTDLVDRQKVSASRGGGCPLTA